MNALLLELQESVRIAFAQIWAHRMRSALTALGVVIGIVAVTLMGTALRGIDIGFESSLALLGNDVFYVQKWPWNNVPDWWNYANRPPFSPADAAALNRIIADTPGSLLEVAVAVAERNATVRAGGNSIGGVRARGVGPAFMSVSSADFEEGRFFTPAESDGGNAVAVLGRDVARGLFPASSAVGQTVLMDGRPYRVVGVLARQGEFLGIFSFDSQMIVPIENYRRYFDVRSGGLSLEVKAGDPDRMADAADELTGAMRRVRGERPEERDNFSINQQQAFEDQLAPIKRGIALAGFFITGLALFVGAIGIMNITFVGVKERTKEIGTRKALGARRRAILLQFLVEAVSICLVGGALGLALTFGLCLAAGRIMPSLPMELSPLLVLFGLLVSVATGVAAGFAPALGAARLDPVEALRYE